VFVGLRSTEFSIRDLGHSLDVLLAVSFSCLLGHTLFEIIKVGDGILIEVNGLYEDRGLGKRISLDLELFLFVGALLHGLSTSTYLVIPFLETTVLFHGLSVML
jgi:hypothetical protein